jgi:hypothetical protein
MAIKAQNQVTILDITDAYSVILSNENQTFMEQASGQGAAATTTTIIAYSYRGSTNVYSFIPASAVGSTHANSDGVYITVNTNPAQELEITVHIPEGLDVDGQFEIPIELYETTTTTGDPLAIFEKIFTYSVAKYGNPGQPGTPPIIYELEYTGTLFNFDNETGTFLAPTSIQVTASSQQGTNPKQSYTGGTITVTPYSATGQAGQATTHSTAITITPSVTNKQPDYLYYIATLSVNNKIVDRQTIGMNRQGANGEDGQDAYLVDITSTNGFIFKNAAISTTLTAHVYKGGVEITTLSDLHSLGLTINWYEGNTKVASDSLTKQYNNATVTGTLNVIAKLEDYSG